MDKQVNDGTTGLASRASQIDVTALTGRVATTETDIDAIDTRVSNNKTAISTMDTRIGVTSSNLSTSLGGGAGIVAGAFVAPSYQIQSKVYRNIGSAFEAVDQNLDSLSSSISSLSQQSATNLKDAKTYTDQKATTTLNDAKGYTDQQSASTLADAKGYTDQQAASTLADAKGYTEQKASSTLMDAKGYTDQKVIDLKNTMEDSTKMFSANGGVDGTEQAAQVTGTGAIAVGNGAKANGAYNTVIGAGASAKGESNTVVGKGNIVEGNRSGAFGDPNVVQANDSYVVGNDNTVTGDDTFVLGNNVNTAAKNAVVLGNNSASDRDNTVSVGAADNERQIIHVKAGVQDTDAVNVQQMNSSKAEAIQTAQSYTDNKVAALNDSFQNYQYQNEKRFGKINERFDRQGAMTAAMMNMATSTAGLAGRNRIGVGAGVQGSEQAVSVGYQRLVNSNTSISVGGAFTQEESSGGVGVGFSW